RRSQVLIADEREIRRVGDRAALRTAAAVLAVTPGARSGKDGATAVDTGAIAGRRWTGGVGRSLVVRDDVGSLPAILDSLHQDVDLLICEWTAGAERERWLRRTRDAGRNELTHAFGRNHGEIDRIVQRTRRAKASGLAMASGAIARIERCKGHDLGRRELARVGPRPARQAVASRERDGRCEDSCDDRLHRSPR